MRKGVCLGEVLMHLFIGEENPRLLMRRRRRAERA